MAFLKKLDSKVAAIGGKERKQSDRSKKNQVCKFFWQGACRAYRDAVECNYAHCLPDDKSRKHVAHPHHVQ
eukprot:6421206-Karenia_brevis.AAC.1